MGELSHNSSIEINSSSLISENNPATPSTKSSPNGGIPSGPEAESKEEKSSDGLFQVAIKLPHHPYEISITVSTQEQVQDLRQSIMETPGTFQYSNFHLEHKGERVNDFVELSEVKGFAAGSELKLVEDPYTEKDARMHLMRIREIIGAAGDRVDTLYGISAGISLHDTVCPWKGLDKASTSNETLTSPHTANVLADYSFDGPPLLQTLLPAQQEVQPRTLKSIGLSAWNPPPPLLRQQGHLLYLQLTTNEGEQYQVTSHISGFFVNKSSNSKFDPFARPSPKNVFAHSLFSLISILSPSFAKNFDALLEANNKRDPLANFQLTNAIPVNPWLVAPATTLLARHQPDFTRTQETYLMAGLENTETLRDWNEEIQSTKELPRQSVQDRVFRERLISKIFAEFNDAAARGAVLVARGEIAPLNPTESKDAQIFVYNNVFYSFGADGVGTFTSEGGDEAARVAVGKDVSGVKAVNQIDVPGLATAGTLIIDYLGKRLVAQSIVPGIFKQREPEEHQVDYGGVEGRDVVADNDVFVPVFSQVSNALKVKPHPVWDKEGKKHHLEGSVETKGLLGTDGRKYILDLYRLTPLDIKWLEEYWSDDVNGKKDSEDRDYPHRMTVLRQELIHAYWRLKISEFSKGEVEKRKLEDGSDKDVRTSPDHESADDKTIATRESNDSGTEKSEQKLEATDESEAVDLTGFTSTLNPDVFCGQVPQTASEKDEWTKDEDDVRAVCDYLHISVFQELLHDLKEGEVGFPMDGSSLCRLMHKRGINIRYLGKLATLAGEDDARLKTLKALAIQEMVARAFKHVANRYLKNIPMVFATACLAHLLNCLLGTGLNDSPRAHLDEEIQSLYDAVDYTYTKASPKNMRADIEAQIRLRFRFQLHESWNLELRHIQLLRNISLKLGLQLTARDYHFTTEVIEQLGVSKPHTNVNGSTVETNGHVNAQGNSNGNGNGNGNGKKKKKHAGHGSPMMNAPEPTIQQVTFHPGDIVDIVPIIKDSCPKSALAEEALEAGKLYMVQNQREVGQELLLESLTLYEQIYGILHPEVARAYHQLAMLYYQMDEKSAAIELAHKAVIISERTLGIDSSETILSYLNLGLFEHANRNTSVAVACVRHALELCKIAYGPKHPDSITTLNNAAVMLQQLQIYHESRSWFEMSLNISEEISGKSSVNTATLLFQLAQALVLDGDHKAAVNRMKEAYSIFLAKLGPNDVNTKESEKWLEQLTQNAVTMAKHAKDVQGRRIRRVLFNPRAGNLGTRSQPQADASSTGLVNGGSTRSNMTLDSRSIEDLMRFIEGGGDITKPPAAKKRAPRGNPRRRGGVTVGTAA